MSCPFLFDRIRKSAMENQKLIFSLILLLLSSLFTSARALAAMAPNYQRATELNAIVDFAAPLFSGESIDSIERVGPDHYIVRAGGCVVTLYIVELPADPLLVGSRNFEVKKGQQMCD
jgi:hypothetical protein